MYRDKLKIILNNMIDAMNISKSHSYWTSNIVQVKKSDENLRLFIDFRKLNSQKTGDAYPMPCIADTLDTFNGKNNSLH